MKTSPNRKQLLLERKSAEKARQQEREQARKQLNYSRRDSK